MINGNIALMDGDGEMNVDVGCARHVRPTPNTNGILGFKKRLKQNKINISN